MKLIDLYTLIKEEEDLSKVDVNKALKQGYYTVPGTDPSTGKETDYVFNITGFKKYSRPLSELYDSIKFYKEAAVPDKIKALAVTLMTDINKLRKDLRTFDSTVHVYQQSLNANQ